MYKFQIEFYKLEEQESFTGEIQNYSLPLNCFRFGGSHGLTETLIGFNKTSSFTVFPAVERVKRVLFLT